MGKRLPGLQKLGACSWECIHRASKTSIRYTGKCVPKINNNVLAVIGKKINALMFKLLKSIYIFESTNRFSYEHICIDIWF